MSEIVLRPAVSEDVPALSALFLAVYKRERSPEHYRWKYFLPQTLYPGPRLWIAMDGDRIIGCAGMMTYPFWLDGAEKLGVSTCEYHVLPEYRRRGIQSQLEGALFEALRPHEPLFALCLPNQNLTPLVRKIGYESLYQLGWMRQRVPRIALWFRRPPSGRRVRIVETPGSECDALWSRLKSRVNCCMALTSAGLRARYALCPSSEYTYLVAEDAEGPIGLMVLGRKKLGKIHEAVIGYYLAASADDLTLASLVDGAVRAAKAAGLPYVRALVPEAKQHVDRWKAFGFRQEVGHYILHVCPVNGRPFPDAMRSPDTFTVHLGDQDFI